MTNLDIHTFIESNAKNKRYFKEVACGELLNRGVTRAVYIFKPDPRYVVKYQYRTGFDNIKEFEIYNELMYREYRELRSYFAECLWISSCGKWLVQRRVRHKKRINSYPEQIPHFFNDCKLTNYGWIGKRFVACDYANFDLIKGFRKMNKKAHWWILGKNKFKMK